MARRKKTINFCGVEVQKKAKEARKILIATANGSTEEELKAFYTPGIVDDVLKFILLITTRDMLDYQVGQETGFSKTGCKSMRKLYFEALEHKNN